MAASVLVGLAALFAEIRTRQVDRHTKSIEKAEPAQKRLQAEVLTEQTKATNKLVKVDSVIRTANLAEAQKANGKAAMVEAAAAEVTMLHDWLNAVQAELDAVNDDLAVQADSVAMWQANLEDAAVDLQSALAAWADTDTSAAAQDLRDAGEMLLDVVTAIGAELDNAPSTAGDDMAVHINVLKVWRQRLSAAAVAYTAAMAACPPDAGSPPALALADAGVAILDVITGLEAQLEAFTTVAELAQHAQGLVDIAQADYDGAQDVLDSLNGPAGSASALEKVVSESIQQQMKAEAQARRAAQLDFIQAMRAREVARLTGG